MSCRITEYMVERFAKLVPLFSMVYTNILIDCSRILRSPWTSECCFKNWNLSCIISAHCHIMLIFVSAKCSEAGVVLQINYSTFNPSVHLVVLNCQSLWGNLQLAWDRQQVTGHLTNFQTVVAESRNKFIALRHRKHYKKTKIYEHCCSLKILELSPT